ncbi:MAG: prephenate/arogenate dehydrogenase family protein [Alphaproteobacteria bacterium]
MFEQITIIGLGLIGSSIARGVREKGLAKRVIAADVSDEVCGIVAGLNIADVVTQDLREAVQGSDCVIMAVPVGAFGAVAQAIGPFLKAGAIVSDVGSVKASVIAGAVPFFPDSVEFVPAHPIAGTEFSGPNAGFAELFEGRWCILTPTPEASVKAVEKISALWEGIGARIEIMEPAHHDLVLGITSHLPHLIAYTIVGTAADLEDDLQSEVIQFSASGFRGFTRIAASDPVMWRDVFLHNKDAVLEILGRFSEDLNAMKVAIERGDGDYLFEVFSKTRDIRKAIMELGPEGYPNPDRMKVEES